MNYRKILSAFLKYLLVFIIGGFVSSELSIRNSRVIIEGEPTIYYAQILIFDENEKPVSNAKFIWSHSISIKPKESCTSVIHEYNPGEYFVTILGAYETEDLIVSIHKDFFIPQTLKVKAISPGQSHLNESNSSSDEHMLTIKLQKE
jgi:hypothetical protein